MSKQKNSIFLSKQTITNLIGLSQTLKILIIKIEFKMYEYLN